MKNIVRNLIALSCASSSAFASPFLAIGDNAELFATGKATAAYNDNILLSASGAELEDMIFTFSPGFDLQFGKDSLVKGSVIGSALLSSYSDNNQFNNQLFGIGSNATYEGGRLSLSGNASFNELDQPTVGGVTGALTERSVTAVGLNGEYEISEKISVGGGVAYGKIDYTTTGGADSKDYKIPVNVYYELTPKVDLSTGIRYTHTEYDVTGANEFEEFYYNVGARGSFTPKLSGSFSVGYTTRTANVGPDDDGTVGADASLLYAYSEKTSLSLTLARGFANSGASGQSYENTNLTLGASSALAADWRVNAEFTYRQLDYKTSPAHTDDYIEASAGVSYVINEHFTASLSYLYRQQFSDQGAVREFSGNVVTLSLSARY
jgi:polysaccharide biosynthesis protein VpsM